MAAYFDKIDLCEVNGSVFYVVVVIASASDASAVAVAAMSWCRSFGGMVPFPSPEASRSQVDVARADAGIRDAYLVWARTSRTA